MLTMVQDRDKDKMTKKNTNYCVFPLKKDLSPNRDLLSRGFGGADITTSATENPMRVSLLALAIFLVVGRWLDDGTASMKLSTIGEVVERDRWMRVVSKLSELGVQGAVCGGFSRIVKSGRTLGNWFVSTKDVDLDEWCEGLSGVNKFVEEA